MVNLQIVSRFWPLNLVSSAPVYVRLRYTYRVSWFDWAHHMPKFERTSETRGYVNKTCRNETKLDEYWHWSIK